MFNYKILQIMPADGWHALYLHQAYLADTPDDIMGAYSTPPLYGWALVEHEFGTSVVGLVKGKLMQTVEPVQLDGRFVRYIYGMDDVSSSLTEEWIGWATHYKQDFDRDVANGVYDGTPFVVRTAN